MNYRTSVVRKPLVLLSMRSEFNKYGTQISSIEHSWFDFLQELFLEPPLIILVPNSDFEDDYIMQFSPDLVVLSGGNDLTTHSQSGDVSENRDRIETSILLKHGNVPILGVCRGFQLANEVLGGRLVFNSSHAGSTHEVIIATNFLKKHEQNSIQVNSYHNWSIPGNGLASELEPLATSKDDSIESAVHKINPWFFTMWHPERAEQGESQRSFVINYARELINKRDIN